jgi:UDP-3-O-[3-hydroxymyristoyl] N-acetylglucosamine deacetylase
VLRSTRVAASDLHLVKPWGGRGQSSWVEGIGIHLGETARVRFHEAPGEPVAIIRDGRRIPLLAENVTATALSTEVGAEGVSVSTVEHLLAALQVLGHWSGFVVEVDGPELPILDGSAILWAVVLEDVPQETAPAAVRPRHRSLVRRGGRLEVEPVSDCADSELIVRVNYPHPLVGEQRWNGRPHEWPELLDARTFGFEVDIERLWMEGRALGARPDNAVVYGAEGTNLPTRGVDEVVRHKALDLLGDLYLVGAPLHARVWAEKASHAAHVALAQAIRQG